MIDVGLIPNGPLPAPFPVYWQMHPLYELYCTIFSTGDGDRVVSRHKSKLFEQRIAEAGEGAKLFYMGDPSIQFPPMILMQAKGSRREQLRLWLGIDQRDLPDGTPVTPPLFVRPWQDRKPQRKTMQKVKIDGVPFVGLFVHYRSPAPFTYVAFSSAATCIRGNFYGPDLKEVFEILSALQVIHSNRERK
jgi:hypothetical protein